MSEYSSGPYSQGITTVDELERALAQAVTTAYDNGVDVEGSYPIRNGSTHPDYEVEVYEVSKPDSPDERSAGE